MRVIAERFGLSGPMPEAVKDADNRILLDERAVLLSEPPVAWQQDGMEPLGVRVRAFSPALAESEFALSFRLLVQGASA